MRGLRIIFGKSGPRFDFKTASRDFDTTVQNTMVNLGTRLGSDPIYPGRGTDLMDAAVKGRMINPLWANHTANFAALRTLAFIQATDVEANTSKLQNLRLRCEGFEDQRVRFATQMISSDGQSQGDLVTL